MNDELRDTIARAIYNHSQEPPEELREFFTTTAWDDLTDIVKAAPRGYADAVLAAIASIADAELAELDAELDADLNASGGPNYAEVSASAARLVGAKRILEALGIWKEAS